MRKAKMVSDQVQIKIVKESKSYSEVLRKLDRNHKSGGAHVWIKRRIEKLGIDISHFGGQKWNVGKSLYKTDEVFAEGSTRSRETVRRFIIRDKLIPYECAFCGNKGEWLGNPMSLELDHINGVHNDHRLENLRFLCPNCHATTDTYCGRNIKVEYEKKQPKLCKDCGVPIYYTSTYCRDCSGKHKRKVANIPEKMELAKLIVDNGFGATGKIFGVSDATIRKWCLQYEIPNTKEKLVEWYNNQ